MSQSVKKQEKEVKEAVNLTGTLYAVSILGIIIILSWFGVWALYLAR